MYYYYDIYENNVFVKSTEDMDYATYCILKNQNSYYIIYSYSDNKEFSLPEGTIKVIDNKVVKIVDEFVSFYSPYDQYLFKRSDLSRLYLKFYNKDTNEQYTNEQYTNEKNNQNLLRQHIIKQNINSDNKINTISTSNNEVNKNNDFDNIPIKLSPTEIIEIQNQIKELNKMKEIIDKEKLKQEEEFLNKDCEERFIKRQEQREKEREIEKYNIFISDIEIYNKLINEKKFSEEFIPPFFVAKYYIIKYLYSYDYFKDENITKPSEELFSLFKMFYEFINNKFIIKEEEDEDIITMLNEFKDFLPQIIIKTDRQIMEDMNKNDENGDMFIEPTGFSDMESSSESCSDLNSQSSDSDIQSEDLDTESEVNDFRSNINKYNEINKNKLIIDKQFQNIYNIIKFLYDEGCIDKLDFDESTKDSLVLYKALFDYKNNDIIDQYFIDEINKFKDIYI